jgi:endonuclease/exonuclease/phosphatase family metal-dependent hydrolase
MLIHVIMKISYLLILLLGFIANSQAATIKVLTFNLYGLPRPFFSNPFYHSRVKNLCNVLKNAEHPHNDGWDVILMQEVLTKKVRRILSNCGYPHVVDIDESGMRKERWMETGLLILSKHPILLKKLIPFTERGDIEGFESIAERIVHRSIQIAMIDFNGTNILIANTHLAPNFAPKGSSNSKARIAQMHESILLIRQFAKDTPFIFGGDLNFGPRAPSWEPLWDKLPNIFPEIANSFNDHFDITFDSLNVLNPDESDGKLDHLFSSQHFVAEDGELALEEFYFLKNRLFNYSDHFGWGRTFHL